MGQFTQNGIIYEEMPGGKVKVVGYAQGSGAVPLGGPDPTRPLDIRSKQIGVQKGEADLQLTPYELRKQKAEAEKAEIDAKNAKDQYDAQHPPVSTSGVYGDAFLKTLSASDQSAVKALDEGRLAFPTGSAMRSPFWQEKLSQVAQYDPNFDATNYNARAKGRAAAISGKLGTSNNALNTAIGHMGQLYSQIGGTASHDFTPLNAVENFASRTFGNPGVTNFEQTAGLLADELESVYRNGGGAEQGIVRNLRSLDPNASRDQKVGVIRNGIDLLASKEAANLAQYNFGTGGKPSWDMLDPHTKQVLDQFPDIRDKYFAAPAGANGATPPPPPPTAPPPVTPGGGTPPAGPTGGVPHADYSGLVGGPESSLAVTDPNSKLGAFQQTYRNEFDPVAANALSTLIRHGASYETAAAYAQSHGFTPPDPGAYAAAVTFAKQHGGATNVQANRSVPTTLGERLASSPLAAGAASAASAGTAGLLDTVGRNVAGPGWDANRAALADTNPNADILGNVVGGAGAMIGGGEALGAKLAAGARGGFGRDLLAWSLKNPLKASVGGDALYGGVYGANENPDDPLAGAGIGTLAGAGGGMFGAGASKVAGGALRGVVNPAAQRLRDAGIPLTVGEVLGGGAKKAQDALTSVFGPGNMVARRYEDGREALNKAAFNQAGQTIGVPIDAVGQPGIQALNTAKSNAYANALNPVSVDLNNPQTIGDLQGAIKAASTIPNVDQASDIATGGLSNYIGNAAPNGVMSGPDFQQAYRGLSRLGRQSSGRVYGHEIGQALGQGQDALVGALQSQNPGAFNDFLNANSANRHLSVLSDAVNAAKNQIGPGGQPLFTPAQLSTAATNNARTYSGKVAAASGDRPFNQLATDAQQVMSSKLPESGTFPRALLGAAIMGGGGMFGGRENGASGATEGALAPLGMLSLLGTRRGQKLLTSVLLDRSFADQIAGRALIRNPQIGAGILTSAGVPFLTGPQAQ